MDWKTVLSTTRVRDHFGGGASVRSSVDLRSEFERDFGRCIYSAPFRRLQDKAQVFPLEPQDAVRTRLTHSIEVSSVARGLGADIGRWLLENKLVDPTLVSPIEVIAATCGMIHDLGNPPFGHAGEQAISEWFEKTFRPCNHLFGTGTQLAQDFLRWDGNAQTIRLITKLQVLADDFGLNLTAGTVSAACKYVAASHEVDKTKGHEYSKPGYFFSESDVVKAVREITGTGVARNPISYLVDAADDIVNATVDLEDGIKKRLITWSELESLLRNKADGNAHFDNAVALAKEKIGTALQGRSRDEGLAQTFRTYAIIEFVTAAVKAFQNHYEEIMGGKYHGDLMKDSSAWPLMQACKDISREIIYRSDEVLEVELLGRQVIQDLLSVFWDGAVTGGKDIAHKEFSGKAYLLMSSNYRHVFERALEKIKSGSSPFPEQYCRLQLVCDYVGGMTDSFAVMLHKRLKNG